MYTKITITIEEKKELEEMKLTEDETMINVVRRLLDHYYFTRDYTD